MEWDHVHLLINGIVSLISAGANIFYIWKHANGKKYVRLVSVFVMLYFTGIQLATAFNYLDHEIFEAEYLRPWMPVLYLIPVFDVIVDFKKKKNPPKKGE